MNTFDSQKVLAHIDDAKNWLDEAKTEYLHSNQVRGELNLNLAQAEVKYAWELSRSQNVIKKEQACSHKWPRPFLPAVAASIVFLLGLGTALYFGIKGNNNPGPAVLTAKNGTDIINSAKVKPGPEQPVAVKVTKLPETSVDTVKPNPVPEPATDETVQVKARDVSLVKSPVKIVKTEVSIAEKKPVAVNQPAPNDRVTLNNAFTKTVPVNTTKPVIREAVEPVTVLESNRSGNNRDGNLAHSKPVKITLVIDEEALTKEAFYSLRNGK
ncbi:MAG TPA: hypothetical protein VIM29_05850 [Bacillota bacterium]